MKEMERKIEPMEFFDNKEPNKSKISKENVQEFIGQVIEVFEDFLEARNIKIDNPEIQEVIKDGSEDPAMISIIYGTDYGEIQSELESILLNWKIVDEI